MPVIEFPSHPPPPRYVAWSYLTRSQLARDHGRRMFYDQDGETVPASDEEPEQLMAWDGASGGATDRALLATVEEFGSSQATMSALAKHLSVDSDLVSQRVAQLQAEARTHAARARDNVGDASDAYLELFCRRCRIYACRVHGGGQLRPTHRPEAEPLGGSNTRQPPCCASCWQLHPQQPAAPPVQQPSAPINSQGHKASVRGLNGGPPLHSTGVRVAGGTQQAGDSVPSGAFAGRGQEAMPPGSVLVPAPSINTCLAAPAAALTLEPAALCMEGEQLRPAKRPHMEVRPATCRDPLPRTSPQATAACLAPQPAIAAAISAMVTDAPSPLSSALLALLRRCKDISPRLSATFKTGPQPADAASRASGVAPAPAPLAGPHAPGLAAASAASLPLAAVVPACTLLADAKAALTPMADTTAAAPAQPSPCSAAPPPAEGSEAPGVSPTPPGAAAWSAWDVSLLRRACQVVGSADCCALARLLGPTHSCRDVRDQLAAIHNAGGGLTPLERYEARKQRRPRKMRKSVFAAPLTKRSGVYQKRHLQQEYELWQDFIPCACEGTCSASCPCSGGHNFCEKFCGCSEKCNNRFRGCRCVGQCRDNKCPCAAAGRECDPDMCRGCALTCEPDGFVGVDDGCHNMRLRLRRHVRCAMGSSGVQGWGAFVRDAVERGDFLGEYTGDLITQDEADRRGRIYDRIDNSYLFNVNSQWVLDARYRGNKLRLANHSPNPNCTAKVLMVDGEHRVAIFARDRIQRGEELLYDYHYSDRHAPDWAQQQQRADNSQ